MKILKHGVIPAEPKLEGRVLGTCPGCKSELEAEGDELRRVEVRGPFLGLCGFADCPVCHAFVLFNSPRQDLPSPHANWFARSLFVGAAATALVIGLVLLLTGSLR